MKNLAIKRYMHDKLHCRMSEDEGAGDWVLYDDVIEAIAQYIERDSQCFMPIRAEFIGETKHSYGLRLLKVMAEELRGFKA